MKTLPKTIRFASKMEEDIKQMMEEKGYISFSAVVHHAVMELYRSYYPAYTTAKKDNSPKGRMKRIQDEREAKIELEYEKLAGICEDLGGDTEIKGGNEYCVYYTYSGKKRHQQEIPVNMLSEDLIKTQYSPSREKVEQLQRDKKVDY